MPGRSIALTPLADAAVGVNQHDQCSLAGTMMMTVWACAMMPASTSQTLLARAAQREKEMDCVPLWERPAPSHAADATE